MSETREISSESVKLIHDMLRDGFHFELRVHPWPEMANGVESGTAMFWRDEWGDRVRYTLSPETREYLEAYSGYEGTCDPNAWIAKAAVYARQYDPADVPTPEHP